MGGLTLGSGAQAATGSRWVSIMWVNTMVVVMVVWVLGGASGQSPHTRMHTHTHTTHTHTPAPPPPLPLN